MAIVKRDSIGFDGSIFKFAVRFVYGEFHVELPPQVPPVLGFTEVTAKTLDEVVVKFKKTLDDYTNAKTTTRKVILYDISDSSYIFANALTEPEVAHGDLFETRGTCLRNIHDIAFCNGTALSIACGVFTEHRTVNTNGKFTYRYSELPSIIPPGARCLSHVGPGGPFVSERGGLSTPWSHSIEWTIERERWFAGIVRALEGLILKLDELTKAPDQLAALIDSGVKLLPAPPEQPARSLEKS